MLIDPGELYRAHALGWHVFCYRHVNLLDDHLMAAFCSCEKPAMFVIAQSSSTTLHRTYD